MNYHCILTEVTQGVGIITLNRPDVMNALNETLCREVGEAVDRFEADDGIGLGNAIIKFAGCWFDCRYSGR